MTAEKKTILLVEDEPFIAMKEASTLEKFGYNVIMANTGEKALSIFLDTLNIDLVLMDIDLGKGMDGTQAAAIILGNRDVPLIFLSSHTERHIVDKTEGISSYGYIVKNTGETVLIASIKMAFRLFELRMKDKENDSFRKRVFESSMIPIVVMDSKTFQLIDCNPAAVSIYGFTSREETLGKTLHDVSALHQYDSILSAEKARYYIDRTIASGQEVFPWLHQRPGGELWDAEVHIMSFYSNDHLYLQFTLKDITEKKQMERMQEIQHQLILDLNSCSDLPGGLDIILQAAMEFDCIDCGGVYITDLIDGSIDLVLHKGLSREFVEHVSHYDFDSPGVRLALAGTAHYGSYGKILPVEEEILKNEGLRAFAVIPILTQGRLIAVFNLASHDHDVIPSVTRSALETIAFQIGGTLLRLRSGDTLKKN